MGMFDYIHWGAPLPDSYDGHDNVFQTKELTCCMQHYEITASGRLMLRRLPGNAPVDMEYHGDIRLAGSAANGQLVDYVARFANGTLEWIRPFEELSEVHKTRLDARD